MAAIFALSAQPVLPQPPGPFTDKHVHAATYAGLSAVTARALAGGLLSAVAIPSAAGGALVATLYGISDELHQSRVPGRDASVGDWIADLVGACGAAFVLGAWSIISRR